MNECSCEGVKTIDLDKSYYNTTTFYGRFRHYLALLNPLNTFNGEDDLNDIQDTLTQFKKGTLRKCISSNELWRMKYMKDAAYHPETGQKVHFLGRYSSQIFMNTLITGAMLTYYKTAPSLMFWQWINQSYNAFCVYCNRPLNSSLTNESLESAYLTSSLASMGTALALRMYTMRPNGLPYICRRFFPLVAAAVGTFIAIPAMRCQDLKYGIPVYDQNDYPLGKSVVAAEQSVTRDMYTRAVAIAPAMILPPLIVHYYEVQGLLCRRPWLHLPLNLALVGFILTLSTPFALAAMKNTEMYYCDLEPLMRYKAQQRFGIQMPYLVFNERRCPEIK